MKRNKFIWLLAVLTLLCACGKTPAAETEVQQPAEPVNGFVRDGDSLAYYIDGVQQAYEPGVQQIDGKAYLVLEDGTICGLRNQVYNPGDFCSRYYLEEDSSLRLFEDGFVELPEGTYRASGYTLSDLTNEIGTVDGSPYLFGDDGRIVELEPGLHELALGEVYLAQEGTAALIKPEQGLLYYGGELYDITEFGTLRTDDTVGYLTFGSDGRYTSGNADLDAAVAAVLDACLTENMTDTETMLRAVYDHLRDNYRYLSGDLYEAGTTDWAEPSALRFFALGKGNCYCWASALMYCARQLGYQAYVVGGWESNPNNVHAWTMIDWPDGETYLFDAELEYAYWYMFQDKPKIDMFKAAGGGTYYNGFAYYFP